MKQVILLWLTALLLLGCGFEPRRTDQLHISIDKSGTFFANGVDQRKVTISFTGDVTRGKELVVTTSLGILNPSAPAAEQRTLKIQTGSVPPKEDGDEPSPDTASPIELTLRAERTAGPGRVTVTGHDGLRDFVDFDLATVADELVFDPPAQPITAQPNANTDITLTLTTNDPLPRDIQLKTNLGRLSPELAEPAAHERKIRVLPKLVSKPGDDTSYEATAILKLFAGSVPGTAVITAEVGSILRSTSVTIKSADDTLRLEPATRQIAADGSASTDLTITVTSDNPQSRSVSVKTTLGKLSPDKKDEAARERTVQIAVTRSDDKKKYVGTRTLALYAGTEAGTAALSAEMDDFSDADTVTFDAVKRSLEFGEMPKAVVANGTDVASFTLTYQGNEPTAVVLVTTTLGVLDPSASSAEERRKRSLTLSRNVAYNVSLIVGNVAGKAVVTAGSSTIANVTSDLDLSPALPTRLALSVVDSSVFDATRSQTGISVALQREPGEGAISTDTSINYVACCDFGGKTNVACTELVSVPPFQVDNNGDGRETTTLTLTPTGRAQVNQKGTPPTDDTHVTLHAFVLPIGGTKPSCETLVAPPADLKAYDNITLALRRLPP